MMIPSHFIEALKVGKRFVLLDLVVKPDCEQPWQSAGPDNKYVSREVWQLVYRKLEDVCRKHFGEYEPGVRKEVVRCELDVEYEYRLEKRPNIVLKYEFKNTNIRDVYNMIFDADQKKLHKECLSVQIVDETWDMFRELEERKKTIERLQEDNERLRAVPEASQEYKPAPVKSSRSNASMSHSEYIPAPLNGSSPSSQSSYKAMRIESTIKVEPDPYTPSSSQEAIPFSYVPSLLQTPIKQEIEKKSTVSSSGESSIRGRRRNKQAEIFGHSDDDEQEEQPSTSPRKQDYGSGNRSVDNIFSEDSPSKAVDVVGSSSDEIRALGDNKRTQLPRKTKNRTPCSPDSKSSQASSSKRRRKDCEPDEGTSAKTSKSSASVHNNSGRLDGWITTNKERKGSSPSRKVGESSSSSKSVSKNKENEKSKKDKKSKKETTPSVPIPPVDREKLRAEAEQMRQTLANLDKLDKMLPEDKSELDVPILDCFKLSIQEIMDTFHTYRDDLRRIFDKYKDQTERQWQKATELCYFLEVTSVLEDDQKYQMMQRLEREFVHTDEDRGKYTEFFSSILIMEWGLRIWMKMFHYEDRQEALDRIKLQEEANPMDMTPGMIASLTASSKKKR